MKSNRGTSKAKHRRGKPKGTNEGATPASRFDDRNLVTGRRALEELLRFHPERVRQIYLREGVELSVELRRLLDEQKQISCSSIPQSSFASLPHAETAQGVMAEVAQLEVDLKSLIQQALSVRGTGLIVICDQVSDPHNLGAILRVSEAAGADGVIATVDRSAPLTPVVRKASAGASELLPLVFVQNLQRAVEELKAVGFWVYGAALEESSISLFEQEFTFPLAIIVGSEGTGLRALTKKLCHQLIQVPMPGRINSLNVSQATSVVLYEALRQRTRSKKPPG